MDLVQILDEVRKMVNKVMKILDYYWMKLVI